jgi:hypothetical protein
MLLATHINPDLEGPRPDQTQISRRAVRRECAPRLPERQQIGCPLRQYGDSHGAASESGGQREGGWSASGTAAHASISDSLDSPYPAQN